MGLIDKLFDIEEGAACKLIIKASEKQRRINALLEEEGADVRIGNIEVQMGREPSFAFCVEPHVPENDSPPAQ